MSKRQSLWALAVLPLALTAAWGQDSSAPQPADSAQSTAQQPVPAYGPDKTVPSISENPPISGLDLPNLEPHGAPLSYLQAGAHFSESVSSNLENSLGGAHLGSITDLLGSVDLERLWSNYDLSLSYLGGVGYYSANGLGFKQIEELGLNQKITWKRGEFGVRDAFSYQPEGTFGSSYGSTATLGAGLGGQGAFFGGTGLGALGQVPRIMNLSLANVVENLTPKSSVTGTVGYGFVHFLSNEFGTGTSFIGNHQITAQVGYNRVLTPHNQGALVYGYQGFSFSTGTTFNSHVIQAMWGHRISGRMDFLVGGGPQFTQINGSLRLTAAGRGMLRYKLAKVGLELSYDHYITSGSGFFAGAESDIARLTATRSLGRVWTAYSDIGYSRNSRVAPLTTAQTLMCIPSPTNPNPNCPGVTANVYQYGFAGAGVRRNFGRNFKIFASYQFNELAFDTSFCGTTGPCSRISQRHTGNFGLDWTPRPIRLD